MIILLIICKKLALAHAAVANDRIRRPEQGMGVREFGLTVGTDVAWPVRQRHHGLTQSLPTRQSRVIRLALEQIGDQLSR
jgi:hypothetical protein